MCPYDLFTVVRPPFPCDSLHTHCCALIHTVCWEGVLLRNGPQSLSHGTNIGTCPDSAVWGETKLFSGLVKSLPFQMAAELPAIRKHGGAPQ